MKQRIAIVFLIVAVTFGVYAPSLRNGFVWDDTALVLRDPLIRSWRLIPEGFRHFLFTDATASNFYRPLQRLSYTWDYAWFAFAPWGWHLTSILLHTGAAVMLFLFLEKLAVSLGAERGKRSTLLAALAALVWAIHPLHTSAVCYVAGRADLLAALFGFGGLWLFLHENRLATAGAALCFLAAMLSKESGVTALGISVVLLLYKRARIWRWLAITLVIVAVYSLLRFSAEREPSPRFTPLPPAATRPILVARAWAEYAGLLIAPVRLHMERDVLPFDRGEPATTLRLARLREYQTLLGIVLIGAFIAWMRWAKRREPLVHALLIAFLIAYLPISNVFALNASVAEHWLYLPGAFLLPAAVWSASRIPLSRAALGTLLGLWMVFLAVRTFVRNFDWRDQRTFLERTIADGGSSARMLINLGALESAEGRQKIAIGHFTNALARSPDQPFARLGLATAHLRAREFDKAREQLGKAQEHPFVRAEAVQNLAILEYQQSGASRVDLLREAAELAPKNWAIQKRYIAHLHERGETLQAISKLREIVQKQPFRAESWRMLGEFWLEAGRPDFAHRAFVRAATLDVHDDESRRKLAALDSK